MSDSQSQSKAISPGKQIEMFQNALDSFGRLDHRSRYARSIKSIVEELEQDIDGAAVALLRNDIASFTVIQKAIVEHVLKNPESVVNSNGISSLLSQDFIRFADASRRALTALKQFELKRKKGGSELSAAIFGEEGGE